MPKGQAEIAAELQRAGISASAQKYIEFIRLERALTESEQELAQEVEKQRGQNYRTAMAAVSGWEKARRSGEYAATVDALIELTKIPMQMPRPNLEQMSRVRQMVRDSQGFDEKDLARNVWQEWARENGSPELDPTVLPTYRAMVTQFGEPDDSFIGPEDKIAFGNWQRIRATVVRQAEEAKRAEGARDEAVGLLSDLEKNPGAGAGEIQQMLTRYPTLGNTQAMKAIEAEVTRGAAGYKATPETEMALQDVQARKEEVRQKLAALDTPDKEEMDDWAWRKKILSKPGARWWAEANGFQIGHMEEDRWVAGPDDVAALEYAGAQMDRKDKEDMPWQHRKYKGAAPTFGQVTVRTDPVVDERALAVDGKYYFEIDEKGRRRYLNAEELGAMVGASDEERAAVGVTMSSDPPPAEQREIVMSGQFVAPRYGDKKGTLTILTNGGRVVVSPDRMVGTPRVTSGGGDPQTMARFFEVARGRTAANEEEKRREDREPGAPDPAPADVAAREAVPEHHGRADKEKDIEQARVASVEEKARKRAEQERADEVGAGVARRERREAEDSTPWTIVEGTGAVADGKEMDEVAEAAKKEAFGRTPDAETPEAAAEERLRQVRRDYVTDRKRFMFRWAPPEPVRIPAAVPKAEPQGTPLVDIWSARRRKQKQTPRRRELEDPDSDTP